MGVAKGTVHGNDYVGAFATAADGYVLIGSMLSSGDERLIRENLDARAIRITVDSSDLVGIFAVANSNGVLVPELARRDEIALLRRELPGINIETIKTDLNALGNNILANDRIAIVNPEYDAREMKQIGDALDVEVVRLSTGGFGTVGANNKLTNNGMVLNNRTTEHEEEAIMKLVGSVSQTTANMGSPNVGLCIIANSKGAVVGDQTTGYELSRITDALGL
ncbi:MAG: translation initiation factor IF-6 [Candidatus Micrarchaeota archaeon]|nr:translation initiation factor IF-6 [Candidatus Micrarchaeota archaeon]